MSQRDLPSMEAHRRIFDAESLLVGRLSGRLVRGIPANREPKMGQVDSNLIRATCFRLALNERSPIGKPLKHNKFSQ